MFYKSSRNGNNSARSEEKMRVSHICAIFYREVKEVKKAAYFLKHVYLRQFNEKSLVFVSLKYSQIYITIGTWQQ